MRKILGILTILITIIFINNDALADMPGSPFKEYYLLQKYSKYVKKDKNGYRIYAANGKVTKLDNNISDGGDYKRYFFENYLSNIGYFVFAVGYYEDLIYSLVNKDTGEEFLMADYPVVFPNKKIITSFPNPEMDHKPTAYKILTNKLEEIEVPEDFSLSEEKLTDKELKKIKKDEEEKKEVVAKLVSDKKTVMEILENYPDEKTVSYVSESLRNDKEVMMKAVSLNSNSLRLSSDKLKDDDELVNIAMRTYPCSLKYASNRLRNDEKITLKIISSDPNNIDCVSDNFKNNGRIMEDVIIRTDNGSTIQYASIELKDNKEFALNLIKKINYQNSSSLNSNIDSIFVHLSERLRNDDEVAMSAATRDPKILEDTSKKDDLNFILKLISQKKTYNSSLIIKYISTKLQNDPIVLNAIKENTAQSNKINK